VPLAGSEKIGQRLHTAGWKSGSVLTPGHARAIESVLQRSGRSPEPLLPGDFLIVVSQTCDIVAPKLETEPYIEVLLVHERDAVDSRKSNLRSTRHISFRARPKGVIYEAHATNRFWVPRELFDEYAPDVNRSLDPKASKRLSAWLGLRYTRPAWPEELVRRLPKPPELEKILKDVSEAVAEIHIAISDANRELPTHEDYRLTVYAIMDADEYRRNRDSREKCTGAFVKLLDLLRQCPGIVVDEDSDLLPGNEFTWQMARMTDQWNLANLTAASEED